VAIGPWLTLFSPWHAYWLFVVVSLGLLLLSAWLVASPLPTAGCRGFAYFALFCSPVIYLMLWLAQMHILCVVGVALLTGGLLGLAEKPQLERRYLRYIQGGLVIALLSKPVVMPMLLVLFFLPETRRKLLLPLSIYAAVSLLFLLVPRLNPYGYNGLHWVNMLTVSNGPFQDSLDVIPMHSDLRGGVERCYSWPMFVDQLLGYQAPPLLYRLPLLAIVVMSLSPLMLPEREQRVRAALVTVSLAVLAHFLSYYPVQEFHYATLLPILPALLWLWQQESEPGLRRLLSICFLVSSLVFLPTPYFLAQYSYHFQSVAFVQRVGASLVAFVGLTVYGVVFTWLRRDPTLMGKKRVGQIWPTLRLGGVLGALLGSVGAAVYWTVPARGWITPPKWTSRELHEHFVEAMAQIQRVLAVEPHNAKIQSKLGCALLGEGRPAEAISQFRRALEIEPDHAEAHAGLGEAYAKQGRPTEAIVEFQRALKTNFGDMNIHNNLGNVLLASGRLAEAIEQFQWALQHGPDNSAMRTNLAVALAASGRTAEAMAQFQQAAALAPDDSEIRVDLGKLLQQAGRSAEAIPQFQQALAIDPNCAEAHFRLGSVLAARNEFVAATPHFRTALRLKPDSVEFHKNWAWLLATSPVASIRNGPEAVEHAERANRLCGGQRPDVLDVLAAAYAEAGWFPEALAAARNALSLATRQNDTAFAEAIRARIALYEAGKPFHQPSTPH
jgi:tetratricopeptide (TPR) repeat protein